MIGVNQKGDFRKARQWLDDILMPRKSIMAILNEYGERGVAALEITTPKKTGLTSRSWYYKISMENGNYILSWNNSNIQNGKNIARLIFDGHGTANGKYIKGIDYISPALDPIIEDLNRQIDNKIKSGDARSVHVDKIEEVT